MYTIITLSVLIAVTSAGLLAPAPVVYSHGPALAYGGHGPVAVKAAVATSFANSNSLSLNPAAVAVAHAAPAPVYHAAPALFHAAPVVHAAAPVVVSHHGAFAPSYYGH